MLSHEIADRQHKIYESLHGKHLQRAFTELKKLTEELQDWNIDEELATLETSYRYMIQYMLDGVKDPERIQVYNHLIVSAYRLTDAVCEKLLSRDSMTLYYGKKRVAQNDGKSLTQLFAILDEALNNLSLAQLFTDSEERNKRMIAERAANDFFDRVWTNTPASPEDCALLANVLQPQRIPAPVAALTVSALTLNLLHAFDEEKTNILIDTYLHHDNIEVQMRALCGLFFVLQQYRRRLPLYEKLHSRLSLLLDDNHFVTDMRNLLLQFIRSRDTEKIVRKLNEEVLPQMMKISPTLYKKIKEDDALNDLESLERNPEWQEIIDRSGIADSLREINDLQMEGADVFMGTFSHLKGFGFFNEIANWFLPFVPEHTALGSLFGGKEQSNHLVRMISSSGFLCNSDKYSFCLSLLQVPEAQRRMVTSQFKEETAALQELSKTELYAQEKERENISNRYLQDLYRFAKLFPRRGEFRDLFSISIEELMQIESLAPITGNEELMRLLGEYFFKREYYADAAYIFVMLTGNNFIDSELYQKTGFCFQSTDNYEVALEYYLKADLIKPDHLWTLRHIATCYRYMKKTDKALEYFSHAEKVAPDNLSVNLNIGHCYLELKQYDKALQYYFKVDYLDTKGTKARRPIAWCSFLADKKEQAWQYYTRILDDKPNAQDFLNAGHVAFAMGHIKKALELYLASIENDGGNAERFAQSFEQDTPDLLHAGIPADEIPILYDQVLYQANEKKGTNA